MTCSVYRFMVPSGIFQKYFIKIGIKLSKKLNILYVLIFRFLPHQGDLLYIVQATIIC